MKDVVELLGDDDHKEIRNLRINELRDLPLEVKVKRAKLLIKEWIDHFGIDEVAVAFSGGRDSTVLVDLVVNVVREHFPGERIDIVFGNTLIEYPQIVNFAMSYGAEDSQYADSINFVVTKPKVNQVELYQKLGKMPVVSKEISQAIDEIRNIKGKKTVLHRFGYKSDKDGNIIEERGYGSFPKKYLHFLDADISPFGVTSKCCHYFKKNPTAELGKKMFVGTTIFESRMRRSSWIKNGCNGYHLKKASSKPISIWTSEDIEEYANINNIQFCEIYDDPNINRTGCYNCPFSLQGELKDKQAGRITLHKYDYLLEHFPKLYDFSMNRAGFKEVLLCMNIPIQNDKQYEKERIDKEIAIIDWYKNLEKNLDKVFERINENLVNTKNGVITKEEIKIIKRRYL